MTAAGNKVDRRDPIARAVAVKGWWPAHRWLILRRVSQLFFLGLFLAGPMTGIWLVKGTLASSLTLDILPLTDPFIALQGLVAGHALAMDALIGAAIVLVAYALIGGRMYCSWVCPVNPISDLAQWLRVRLGWTHGGLGLNRRARLWILAAILVVSALTGSIVWELVNPVTALHRGLVFGSFGGASLIWTVVFGVFLLELAGGHRSWCSHLCPVGAFYGLLGAGAVLGIGAPRRDACDDCRACYLVCPEPHVLTPAIKGPAAPAGVTRIASGDCTHCGRCIDACSVHVFDITWHPPFRSMERPNALGPGRE